MPDIILNDRNHELNTIIAGLMPGEEVRLVAQGKAIAALRRLNETTDSSFACKAGSAANTVHWMADDFDAPLEDFREYME